MVKSADFCAQKRYVISAFFIICLVSGGGNYKPLFVGNTKSGSAYSLFASTIREFCSKFTTPIRFLWPITPPPHKIKSIPGSVGLAPKLSLARRITIHSIINHSGFREILPTPGKNTARGSCERLTIELYHVAVGASSTETDDGRAAN